LEAEEGQEKDNLRITMIGSHLRYLVKICQRYARHDSFLFEDLIMAGYSKMNRALDAYDPSFKITFWGFARQNVIYAIREEHHQIVFGRVSGYYTGKDIADHQAGITKNRPQVISMDYRMPDDEDDEGFASSILPFYDITPLDELCSKGVLDQLLSTLRPDRKEMVLDWAINGLPLKEIAKKQGITKKAVEGRLTYALLEIKRHGIEAGLIDKRYSTLKSKYECYWARDEKLRTKKRSYYTRRKIKQFGIRYEER